MTRDLCDAEGARRLKERIEAFWRELGYEVKITLPETGFVAAMRSARTDVRSNMSNGLPKDVVLTRALAKKLFIPASSAKRQGRTREPLF